MLENCALYGLQWKLLQDGAHYVTNQKVIAFATFYTFFIYTLLFHAGDLYM